MTGLISGKRVWNEGEGDDEYRHRCLVRGIIKMRVKDRQEAHVWLFGGMGKDGKYFKGWNALHPDSRLIEDIKDQWSKGNRGTDGEWK